MANYDKIKLKVRDGYYADASIYKLSKRTVQDFIKAGQDTLSDSNVRLTKTERMKIEAEISVLQQRLKDIETASDLGLYTVKSTGTLLYLAGVEKERIARRKQSDKAREQEEELIKEEKERALQYSPATARRKYDQLYKKRKQTEGQLTLDEQVMFETLHNILYSTGYRTEEYIKRVDAERAERRKAISRDPFGLKKKRQVIADKKTKGRILDSYSKYSYEGLLEAIKKYEQLDVDTYHKLTFEDGQRLEIAKMCREKIDKYVHDHRKLDDGPDEVKKLREEGQRKVREEVEKLKKRQREYKARLKTDDKILPQTKTKADDGMLPQ